MRLMLITDISKNKFKIKNLSITLFFIIQKSKIFYNGKKKKSP